MRQGTSTTEGGVLMCWYIDGWWRSLNCTLLPSQTSSHVYSPSLLLISTFCTISSPARLIMQSHWKEERGRREGKGERAEKWLEHVLNGKRKEEEYCVPHLATLHCTFTPSIIVMRHFIKKVNSILKKGQKCWQAMKTGYDIYETQKRPTSL